MGTWAQPYIIDFKQINANAVDYGLNISNTDKPVKIKDSYIYSATLADIYLNNVTNVMIENCTIYGNSEESITLHAIGSQLPAYRLPADRLSGSKRPARRSFFAIS